MRDSEHKSWRDWQQRGMPKTWPADGIIQVAPVIGRSANESMRRLFRVASRGGEATAPSGVANATERAPR